MTNDQRSTTKESLTTIPKIIHQIWIGTPVTELPQHKQAFMETWKSKLDKDWQYMLWTDQNVTRNNFDLTWDFLQKTKRIANETGENKFAQLADLMRYEIVYKFGGFYVDTNMECFRSLESYTNHTLVVSHENGLPSPNSCSNGFFGAIKGHPMLKEMTNHNVLSKRNYESRSINVQTGPGFFGMFVSKQTDVFILDTNMVYPTYQGGGWGFGTVVEQDKCLSEEKISDSDDGWKKISHKNHQFYWKFPCDQYPRALMGNHFAFGASWK